MNKLPIRLAAGSGPTFGVDDLSCAAATHLGIWNEEGLDVNWTPVNGGMEAMQAVVDNSVDVAYGGLGPALRFRSEGKSIKIVVSMARALAQNLVVQKKITNTSDLAGVSWALDGFGALSHHMARLIVKKLELSEKDIKWEAVGPPPERISRLLNDTIDASLIRVEEAIALNRDPSNNLHTLLGFAELKKLVPVQPHGVLATSDEYTINNGPELQMLTNGIIRASRLLHDDFDSFKFVYEKNVSVDLPPDEVKKIWKQESDSGGFAVNGELTKSHWQDEMSLFYELNPELPKVKQSDIINEEFVKKSLHDLGIFERPDLN